MIKCTHCSKDLSSEDYRKSALKPRTKTVRYIQCTCGNVMLGKFSVLGVLKSVTPTPEDTSEETQAMIKEAKELFAKEGHSLGKVEFSRDTDEELDEDENCDNEDVSLENAITEELEGKLDKANNEIGESRRRIDALEDDIVEYEKKTKKQEEIRKGLIDDLGKSGKTIKELQKEIKIVRDEKSSLESDIEDYRETISDLTSIITNLEADIEEYKKLIKEPTPPKESNLDLLTEDFKGLPNKSTTIPMPKVKPPKDEDCVAEEKSCCCDEDSKRKKALDSKIKELNEKLKEIEDEDSEDNEECPMCRYYMGRIYELEGGTKRYLNESTSLVDDVRVMLRGLKRLLMTLGKD